MRKRVVTTLLLAGNDLSNLSLNLGSSGNRVTLPNGAVTSFRSIRRSRSLPAGVKATNGHLGPCSYVLMVNKLYNARATELSLDCGRGRSLRIRYICGVSRSPITKHSPRLFIDSDRLHSHSLDLTDLNLAVLKSSPTVTITRTADLLSQ